MEFFWRKNITAGTASIVYDYIGFDGSPNTINIPYIMNTSSSITNCTAIYNGADNGRVDFVWYKDSVLQSYNGSSANVNNLTTVGTNVTPPMYKANWTCSVRAYNGSAYSNWVNSTNLNVQSDMVSPVYSLNSTNTTLAGQPTLFSLNWIDETGLSGYIFNFCNGTWSGSMCLAFCNPTIQLQTANTENLGDLYCRELWPDDNYDNSDLTVTADSSGNERRTYIKFNISSIPVGATIVSATLSLYETTAGNTTNTSVYHVNDTTWNGQTESTLTWNNQPCGTGFTNGARCNLTAENTVTTLLTPRERKYWTVTQAVGRSYSNGDKNVSFVLKSLPLFSVDTQTTFEDKNNGTSTYMPYLNITYTYTGNCGWSNDTWVSMTGAGNWSNVTKTVNSTIGANISWCIYANDTSNNWNGTSCVTPFSYLTTAGGDSTPPTFSGYNANTTIAGNPVNVSIIINDETALSGYIFETNNTGTWINYTWTALASGGTAYNITTLNSTVGAKVNVSFYANDSSNNWAVYRATITTSGGGDTCGCSSIQAGTSINCAENCDIGACNVGGIAVIFTSTGTITTSGDVINILRTTWSLGCKVVIGSGKRWG
jgi:hypothetical protein